MKKKIPKENRKNKKKIQKVQDVQDVQMQAAQHLGRISSSVILKLSLKGKKKEKKKMTLKEKTSEEMNFQKDGQRLALISNSANPKHSKKKENDLMLKGNMPEANNIQMKGQRLGHMSNTGIFSRETIKKVVCISIHNI